MATTPLTGSRYPVSSDSANVAQYFANLAFDLDDNTIPRFSTTTARDNAYSAFVTAGGVMADGMHCVVNGVPYRRINGTWRIDRHRKMKRSQSAMNSGAGISIVSGGSAESGVTAGVTALSSITLYEAGELQFTAQFRAGGTGAALCYVKVNGATVGNTAVSRFDMTVGTTGQVSLAAGTHTVAVRVDATGSTVTWIDHSVTFHEGTAE